MELRQVPFNKVLSISINDSWEYTIAHAIIFSLIFIASIELMIK